ncbi:hypothetical protein PSA87_00855 [Limosilactobacillus reuteri]|uniref:hypothetical protein n=1 Tax=Limosilactobacillus TaxID=2742598 RepID=UPI00232B3CFF|nr:MULTISPECIES: hypothetical protein [Limosilactobacillus]MDD1400219.1 hypothetical protein [Limosilactobacillus reuteri]
MKIDAGISGWGVLVFWLITVILTSGDSNVLQAISFVVDVIEFVIWCLPSGYINKQGWWSPNYDNDVEVPSLRNE